MNCSTRMSSLEPPLTTIFGVMFILTSFIASIANSLVLFVLWKPGSKITSSTKILTSLAVSDLLVGMILSPLTCWQVLSTSLRDCNIDYIRRYFVVFLTGSSVLTLAMISYDRYTLLTKLTNYNKYITKRKVIAFFVFAWLVPAVIPVLQLKIFGTVAYLVAVTIIFFGPLLVLICSYYFILRVIHRQERTLRTYDLEVGAVSEDNINKGTSKNSFHQIILTERKKRKERKQIALAKSVTVLIICYTLCLMPSNAWMMFHLLNSKYKFLDWKVFHAWYIISTLATQLNSCINPVIYFLKNPEFRKRAKISLQRT